MVEQQRGVTPMHCMIDLETLDTTPFAAVLSIGAVIFDGSGILDKHYVRLDENEQLQKYGRTQSDATRKWWEEQSSDARKVFEECRTQTRVGLVMFGGWLSQYNVEGVWGYGSTFDNTIMHTLFTSVVGTQPWSYRCDRCFRTLKELFPHLRFERIGTHHNALDDAESQAIHAIELLKRIQNGSPS